MPQPDDVDALEAEPDGSAYDAGRIQAVKQSFQPSAPVKTRDLFSGRYEQIAEIVDVVEQAGLHGAVFGERGVGKTSLVRIMTAGLSTSRVEAVRVNCSAKDSFPRIWHRVLGDIAAAVQSPSPGFRSVPAVKQVDLAQLLSPDGGPDEVRRALAQVVEFLGRSLVIFLDEFDRLEDATVRAAFADTLKALSDQDVDATIVIVGVADNISELVAEHASIERNLSQIHMPRMSEAELREIISTGLRKCDLAIMDDAMSWITSLSIGLPHYTHLLAQKAALRVLDLQERSDIITTVEVQEAIRAAIKGAQQSVRDAYNAATASNRSESLYREVLLACALANTDDTGFFKAGDLRDPLAIILGRIPQFAQHLKAFTGVSKRGQVLETRGSARQVRYRFANPLVQPYVLMRGMEDGLVDAKAVVGKI